MKFVWVPLLVVLWSACRTPEETLFHPEEGRQLELDYWLGTLDSVRIAPDSGKRFYTLDSGQQIQIFADLYFYKDGDSVNVDALSDYKIIPNTIYRVNFNDTTTTYRYSRTITLSYGQDYYKYGQIKFHFTAVDNLGDSIKDSLYIKPSREYKIIPDSTSDGDENAN